MSSFFLKLPAHPEKVINNEIDRTQHNKVIFFCGKPKKYNLLLCQVRGSVVLL